MPQKPASPPKNRIGFHYFPDSLHYREKDMQTWLPQLTSLGCNWLTLEAPIQRAIPEYFINAVISEHIEPVAHFSPALDKPVSLEELALIFQSYARWGMHYVALFDRPNTRPAWNPKAWAQVDLIERFLDIFLPLAQCAEEAGLRVIFPPLQPGGDYWDTAFLQGALRGLQRRGANQLLDNLILGAYAWAGNRSLQWGAGGQERWPASRPYFTPPGAQDQCGFRIFDWYLTIARAELGKTRPVMLLRAGSLLGDRSDPSKPAIDEKGHTEQNLAIARLMSGLNDPRATPEEAANPPEKIPSEVLSCNFWLLSAEAGSPHARQAWFPPQGEARPSVPALQQWAAAVSRKNSHLDKGLGTTHGEAAASWMPGEYAASAALGPTHPIAHYLLLPVRAWGLDDWDLDMARTFLKEHRPTIGFSIEEASLAQRVTIAGGLQAFPEEVLESLRSAGCKVERLIQDGTVLAS